MKRSAWLIFSVLAVVLFGGHFAKGQQKEDSNSGQEETDDETDSADVDEQNKTNQPSDTNRAGRIMGGVPVTSANQPYAVIMNAVSKGIAYFSGAVISNTEVLTSASTLRSFGNITVLAAAAGSNPSFHGGKTYLYKSYELHSGFNPTTLENDVAIVTINGTFSGQTNVKPIAIATTEISISATNRTKCVVVGWGQIAGGIAYENVSETNYELLTDQECAAGGVIPSSIVCARPAGRGFACNYDGGVPLVCNGQLYGILTAQTSCNITNPPPFQKFAKLPVIRIPWNTPTIPTSNATLPTSNVTLAKPPRKNYVSCP